MNIRNFLKKAVILGTLTAFSFASMQLIQNYFNKKHSGNAYTQTTMVYDGRNTSLEDKTQDLETNLPAGKVAAQNLESKIATTLDNDLEAVIKSNKSVYKIGVKKKHSYVYPPVYTPAMSRDETTFYFAGANGLITALNTESDTLWKYQIPGHLEYSPTVGYDGTIYCAGNSMGPNTCTILIALNPDGSCDWEYDLGAGSIGPIATTPEGMIYVATEDSLIHGIDSNSNELWTCQIRGSYYREIVVGSDGTIYTTAGFTDDPVIFAISKTGDKLWECDLPGAESGSGYLVWGDDVLYYFDFYGITVDMVNIGVSDGLYAVNLDGTLRWHRLEPTISTQLAVGKDTIYAMGEYATLFALSKDGILQWERKLSETNWHRSSITPIIAENNIIYAADFTSDYFIHAVTSEGELLWTIETGLNGFILDSHGMLHWFHRLLHDTTQTTSLGLATDAPWPCEGGNPQRTYCAMTQSDVSIAEETAPVYFAIIQNYPNPFNEATTIQYQLPENSRVSLDVYNISGQKIKTLVDKIQEPGLHQVNFNTSDLPSGIYFSRLKTQYGIKTQKMMLVK